jgi:hypothetical protein
MQAGSYSSKNPELPWKALLGLAVLKNDKQRLASFVAVHD